MEDPFAIYMAPPEGETAEQRVLRIAAQQNADKTSRQIDEVLLQSKKLLEKKEKDVKILLLGTYPHSSATAAPRAHACVGQASRSRAKSVLISMILSPVLTRLGS